MLERSKQEKGRLEMRFFLDQVPLVATVGGTRRLLRSLLALPGLLGLVRERGKIEHQLWRRDR